MKIVGIIFSNIHDKYIPELTKSRTLGSVPFGGRYRLIDFSLSNMVNCGIDKVGIITKSNYQSLMDHIGSGKDWDLSRKNGGVMLLPPFGISDSNALYKTRLEALKGITTFLNRCTEDYVIMSDCDKVLNMDFNKMIKEHRTSGADITVAYKETQVDKETAKKSVLYEINGEGKVIRVLANPDYEGKANVCLNIMMLKKQLLLDLITEAVNYGYESLHKDILGHNANNLNIRGYCFDGYYACIDSLKSYYKTNMEMLIKENRDKVFGIKDRPIYTKIRDSAAAKYGEGANVTNSLISDGCVINGSVNSSILFRDVYIGKGSIVNNSIIMQNTYIGENVTLNGVIIDKNAVIRDKKSLTGCAELPYFVPKGFTL
jgi:glucose-1-phosphate adenylyltransferase